MGWTNTDPHAAGDFHHQVGDATTGAMLVKFGWTPSLQADEAADDSDKTLTVPASTEWIVKWIWVELITDANAGARQIEIQILDGAADIIARLVCGDTQIESLTRYYLFAPNVAELTAERDTDKFSTLMPEWILPATYSVRIWDNNAVAAGTDDMVVQMQVLARSV